MKKLIVALFLTMAMSAHASNLESVVLNDGTIVNASEILNAHFIPLTNKIDFIELTEGSRIESDDIKTVNFKTLLTNKFLRPGIQIQSRVGGDGSGG